MCSKKKNQNGFVYMPPQESLNFLYHDEHILVLSKPSGLLSVPGKRADHQDCMEKRAQEYFPAARIVHRLDMATSGVMVMAMTGPAHRNLGLQFERRKVRKVYVARIWGCLEKDRGAVDLPLICDWPNRPKQKVDWQKGKPAHTEWVVIGRDDNSTRVRLYPLTGRSHQLRVHMLALGHPVLGDDFYAPPDALAAADRLQLHAECLSFYHPASGEALSFTVPCPF